MSTRLRISSDNASKYFYLELAMKIAKLAADDTGAGKYKGLGSFMIQAAKRLALGCNNDYCACRFLTVDADIEHNEGVRAFYEKTAFS
jgi:hypothetical protein